VSSIAATPTPVAVTAISVSLAKVSQPIPAGFGGTATVQRPTTHGLPAAVDAALQAPAAKALTTFEQQLKSSPCTGAGCTPADFLATFVVGRSDTAIVSGTWTILTFFPGAAHPETVLVGIIVRATDGAPIAPAEFFRGDDLTPLGTPLRPALQAQLDKIGCGAFDPGDVAAATQPTATNYQGVAVTSTGLLVGYSDDQVAAHACGEFEVPIAWGAIAGSLGPLGSAVAARTALPAESASAGECGVGVLDVEFGTQRQIAVGQFQIDLVFTNTGGETCWLQGFPGVDLTGFGNGTTNETISLRRAVVTPVRVTLTGGGVAHAALTYLVGPDSCDAGGSAWTPDGANLTPPDATLDYQLYWPGNSVDDCQQAATHPGIYIGPVLPGA
jgi:hypothetical protein